MALAEEMGCPVLSVDDLARASSDPALAFERDNAIWKQSPDVLCELLIRKGEALWPEIRRHVEESQAVGRTLIIEGEGPSPDLVNGLIAREMVRPAFIVERDAERLHQTLWVRSERYRVLPAWQRMNVVGMNLRYGEWLIEKCTEAEVPWLRSQPWNTLRARLASAWDVGAALLEEQQLAPAPLQSQRS